MSYSERQLQRCRVPNAVLCATHLSALVVESCQSQDILSGWKSSWQGDQLNLNGLRVTTPLLSATTIHQTFECTRPRGNKMLINDNLRVANELNQPGLVVIMVSGRAGNRDAEIRTLFVETNIIWLTLSDAFHTFVNIWPNKLSYNGYSWIKTANIHLYNWIYPPLKNNPQGMCRYSLEIHKFEQHQQINLVSQLHTSFRIAALILARFVYFTFVNV